MAGVRFANSASKHHISHDRAAHIINNCGFVLPQPSPREDADDNDERLIFLGDDWNGIALEVIAIEGADGELLVIHAQKLRAKNRDAYKRVIGYRK
jgi:hypothetical protein